VHDLIGGKTTVPKLQTFKDRATEIFRDATFTLHKWHSNAPELKEPAIDSTSEETFAKQQLATAHRGESSILGLRWEKRSDQISITVPLEAATTTKRGILRKLAKIYDPLGLVSPQVLLGKFIYRETCNRKIGWDAPIEEDLKRKWLLWEQNLPKQVSTPRSLVRFREEIESIELHAFGDASGEGVSIAVYAIVHQPSGVSQGLVAAKSRLAKRGLTIPRLELVSAHMAANLVGNVQRALD
jgi:hypothetical protein